VHFFFRSVDRYDPLRGPVRKLKSRLLDLYWTFVPPPHPSPTAIASPEEGSQTLDLTKEASAEDTFSTSTANEPDFVEVSLQRTEVIAQVRPSLRLTSTGYSSVCRWGDRVGGGSAIPSLRAGQTSHCMLRTKPYSPRSAPRWASSRNHGAIFALCSPCGCRRPNTTRYEAKQALAYPRSTFVLYLVCTCVCVHN